METEIEISLSFHGVKRKMMMRQNLVSVVTEVDSSMFAVMVDFNLGDSELLFPKFDCRS